MGELVSTGLQPLDRELGGGVPAGTVVALSASPKSESELIFERMLVERPSLYLSTVRSEAVVRSQLRRTLPETAELSIQGIEAEYTTRALGYVRQVDFPSFVVVDTVNPIERSADPAAYRGFLDDLKLHLLETNGVALLHCVSYGDEPTLRETTLTAADTVWDLRSTVGTSGIEEHLAVRKFRGGDVSDETVKLEFGAEVDIDTSRDIA
jgi:KaiC/GvpD/RAD55 family RecA-like ATPase